MPLGCFAEAPVLRIVQQIGRVCIPNASAGGKSTFEHLDRFARRARCEDRHVQARRCRSVHRPVNRQVVDPANDLRSRQHETVFIRVSHGRGISRLQLALRTARQRGEEPRVGGADDVRVGESLVLHRRLAEPAGVVQLDDASRGLRHDWRVEARDGCTSMLSARRDRAELRRRPHERPRRRVRSNQSQPGRQDVETPRRQSAFRHGPRARNSTPPLRSSRTFAQPPMKNALAAIEL